MGVSFSLNDGWLTYSNFQPINLSCVCLCVCLCVRVCSSGIGSHTVWPPGLKLSMEDHIYRKGKCVCLCLLPPTPKEYFWWSVQPKRCISGKTYKTQVEEHPQFSGGGSGQLRSHLTQVSGGGPSSRGASAGMVRWLSGLKLGWEIGTHLGRVIFYVLTEYPNPHDHGAIKIWFQS